MRGGVILLAAALGACAARPAAPPRAVMKCPTVPPLRQTAAPPLRPAGQAALTLVPGHWDWANMDYSWSPPAWVPRGNGHIWQDGFWTASGITCYWTSGRVVP